MQAGQWARPCQYGIGILEMRDLIPIATIGHTSSKNAKKYGWGYSPNESINILDPDKGVKYSAPANNHGWRDKDRH
jgi:hypothetical protein